MVLIFEILVGIFVFVISMIPLLLLLAIIAMFVDRGKRKSDTGQTENSGGYSDLVKGSVMLTHDEFLRLWESGHRDRVTGVYILHNTDSGEYFVEQSGKALHAIHDRLTGSGGDDVYRDVLSGDTFTVRVVKLTDSNFDNLDDLEEHITKLLGV